MNKRTIICALLTLSFLLAPGTSHARWLSVSTGRFHTMDSYEGDQENPATLHKYVYVANNPVNMVDPSGHDFELGAVLGSINGIGNITSFISPVGQQIQMLAQEQAPSAANLARRNKIDVIARKYDGSHKWDFAVKKDEFPPNSNKCNKFVYDVTKEAGAAAIVTAQRTQRPPLAAEYADKNTKIPNWRPLKETEKAQSGDIAAYRLEGGGASFSGHTGFITSKGNISAHDDGVYGKPGQFENSPDTHYRRYTGN